MLNQIDLSSALLRYRINEISDDIELMESRKDERFLDSLFASLRLVILLDL